MIGDSSLKAKATQKRKTEVAGRDAQKVNKVAIKQSKDNNEDPSDRTQLHPSIESSLWI